MNERSFLFYPNQEACQEEKDQNYVFRLKIFGDKIYISRQIDCHVALRAPRNDIAEIKYSVLNTNSKY